MNKKTLPEGCVVLNYSNAKQRKLPNADSIPTLSKIENLPVFRESKEQYYKIEAIDFPLEGTGGTYTKKFFQSFINKLSQRPYPGSKRGHEFLSRPNTDFYTVGGLIEENADGESGTAYLKMYIPEKLDSDNYGFINDCKAGIVHFSLVTLPKHVMKKDASGAEKTYFIGSEGYERNDAVEYGAGAMAQVVNEKASSKDEIKELKELIASGKYDAKTKTDGEIIQNGLVMRSVLRQLVSHADVENKEQYSDLISLIDKLENKRRKTVDKKELFELLANLYKNGQTNLEEIAEAVGFSDKVRTVEDQKNADAIDVLLKDFGTDYVKAINDIKKENEINAELAVVNAIIPVVGAEKTKNSEGEDEENLAYTRALELCKGKTGEALKEAVANLCEDKLIKAVRKNQASVDDGVSGVKISGETHTIKTY